MLVGLLLSQWAPGKVPRVSRVPRVPGFVPFGMSSSSADVDGSDDAADVDGGDDGERFDAIENAIMGVPQGW